MKGFQTERIFILDCERDFNLAEQFKSKLEIKIDSLQKLKLTRAYDE